MKKMLGVLLAGVMAGVLVSGLILANPGTTQAEAKTKSDKAVVLYFSGTGNTARIAKKVKKASGGKLIRIKASDPYTDADLNFNNRNSRVVREHESAASPAQSSVRPGISNLSSIRKVVKGADVVYIGYPIWWGEAPHIMYTLVDKVSFNGKKVVPFTSSLSSGIGESSENLRRNAKTNKKTKWLAGKSFFNAGPSQKTISKWVKKVG